MRRRWLVHAAFAVLITSTPLLLAPGAVALIALVQTPAALTNFAPGQTAIGTGTLTVTDTSGQWTLQVQDQGSGAGHIVAAATGCTNSDAQLTDPLRVNLTGLLTGVTSGGTVSLSAANQTVASATSVPLVADVFTTNYTQPIPTSESLIDGCAYTMTVTYTLQ